MGPSFYIFKIDVRYGILYSPLNNAIRTDFVVIWDQIAK